MKIMMHEVMHDDHAHLGPHTYIISSMNNTNSLKHVDGANITV